MRKPMITRTVTTTDATLLCVNVRTQETCKQVVALPRTYSSDRAVLRTAKKLYETDELKVVQVLSCEVNTRLYGMTEAEFLQTAKILPPRNQG